jgi:hypothetical protein
MKYAIEYTDTFGGQANYSWVRRETIEGVFNTRRVIIFAARSVLGLHGVRCDVADHGDMIELRPRRMNVVAFITPVSED